MKNILLATTALFATAGFAAAEVSLSGSAEMGLFATDTNIDDADDDLQFHTDINVDFTLSGSTDTGLTFGAEIGLEEAEGGVATRTEDDFSVFVSGAFGTLTMGDTDGAYDRVLQEAIIGADIIDSNEHAGYNGNNGFDGLYDGQVARYDYAVSNFNFAASLELGDSGESDLFVDTVTGQPVENGSAIFGIGANYTFPLFGDEHTVGLGIQTVDELADDFDDSDATIIGISGDFNFGDLNLIVNYSQVELGDDFADVDPTHFGLAVGYTIDALTLAVNYGEYEDWILGQNANFKTATGGVDDFDPLDSSGIGFIANYDLGGGLEAQFGYARSVADDFVDTDGDGVGDDDLEEDVYSLGLSMSF